MRAAALTSTIFLALSGLMTGAPAMAHHCFAVFFDDAHSIISVRGKVADFQFRDPHGLIRVTAHEASGAEIIWKAETNSPSILERRGWTRASLKYGEEIVVEGWPARDGSNYMRMRRMMRADGTPVGDAAGLGRAEMRRPTQPAPRGSTVVAAVLVGCGLWVAAANAAAHPDLSGLGYLSRGKPI